MCQLHPRCDCWTWYLENLNMYLSALPLGQFLAYCMRSGDTPSLKGFDKFMTGAVYKLSDTCDDLDMGTLGSLLTELFTGVRYVVLLASKSKIPSDMMELQPHLKPITDVVGKIRALRLKRDFDNHCKAINEILPCVSWVTCRAPTQLPAPFVKECIGSSDFWSNRIRKEFKGKEDDAAKLQLAFCDSMKKLLEDLAAYINEFHKTGLEFNPKGVSIAEAAIVLTDNPQTLAAAAANRKNDQKTHKLAVAVGNTVKGGNMAGMVAELAGRRNDDGSSAATGLKKVRQQRKDSIAFLNYRQEAPYASYQSFHVRSLSRPCFCGQTRSLKICRPGARNTTKRSPR